MADNMNSENNTNKIPEPIYTAKEIEKARKRTDRELKRKARKEKFIAWYKRNEKVIWGVGGLLAGAGTTAGAAMLTKKIAGNKAATTPIVAPEDLAPSVWDEREQATIDACKDLDFPNSSEPTITQF